jgi:hypothetical protein
MSSIRVSNIEAKADASSPTVNEKVTIKNSSGNILMQLDGATAGVTTIGINSTAASFTVDSGQNINFTGIITAPTVSATTLRVGTGVTISAGIVTASSDVKIGTKSVSTTSKAIAIAIIFGG